MAFSGFILQINGSGSNLYQFPMEYIQWESYKAVIGSQDLDSYRDANGVLHRNALKTRVPKVEFQLREGVKSGEFETIMTNLQNRYQNGIEKKVNVTAYFPEIADYITFDSYIPDIETVIKKVDRTQMIYKSIRFAFIGYGKEC